MHCKSHAERLAVGHGCFDALDNGMKALDHFFDLLCSPSTKAVKRNSLTENESHQSHVLMCTHALLSSSCYAFFHSARRTL